MISSMVYDTLCHIQNSGATPTYGDDNKRLMRPDSWEPRAKEKMVGCHLGSLLAWLGHRISLVCW